MVSDGDGDGDGGGGGDGDGDGGAGAGDGSGPGAGAGVGAGAGTGAGAVLCAVCGVVCDLCLLVCGVWFLDLQPHFVGFRNYQLEPRSDASNLPRCAAFHHLRLGLLGGGKFLFPFKQQCFFF